MVNKDYQTDRQTNAEGGYQRKHQWCSRGETRGEHVTPFPKYFFGELCSPK